MRDFKSSKLWVHIFNISKQNTVNRWHIVHKEIVKVFMHANSSKSKNLMLTFNKFCSTIFMKLASSLCASHSSLRHSFISSWICESRARREPNRTRQWLWTDGAPFTKTPASVGMLNIAVFICHYCTPQSMSHEPEIFISIQPAAALSPALGARLASTR